MAADDTAKKKKPKRRGHRGYLMDNASIDQNIVIFPGGFAIKKIAEKGFPKRFCWPVYDDYEGAIRLIDAVMAKNLAEITNLQAQYPEYDFGLDEYCDVLKKEYVGSSTITIRKIKTVSYKHGIDLDYTIEKDEALRKVSIVGTFRRGAKVLGRKTLVSKVDHGQAR